MEYRFKAAPNYCQLSAYTQNLKPDLDYVSISLDLFAS